MGEASPGWAILICLGRHPHRKAGGGGWERKLRLEEGGLLGQAARQATPACPLGGMEETHPQAAHRLSSGSWGSTRT